MIPINLQVSNWIVVILLGKSISPTLNFEFCIQIQAFRRGSELKILESRIRTRFEMLEYSIEFQFPPVIRSEIGNLKFRISELDPRNWSSRQTGSSAELPGKLELVLGRVLGKEVQYKKFTFQQVYRQVQLPTSLPTNLYCRCYSSITTVPES